MKTDGMVKQEHILEAAIKRFSHFGIQKTTLTEVADDLSMTKQTLYYYFPDKQSLIAAVEEKITTEYIDDLTNEINGVSSVEMALLKMIEVRQKFLERYFMLAEQVRGNEVLMSCTAVVDVKKKLHEREVLLLVELFRNGAASGELKPFDVEKTASLLLDTFTAFSHCINDKKGLPEPQDFKAVFQKQKDLLHIFYNGLKK